MTGSLFLAGATGAIGKRLAPLLIADGWRVTGATRSAARTGWLRAMGVAPVVFDVYDAPALAEAVAAAKPEVVVHQLTDLPPGLDPARLAEARARNARLREEGTRNLVAAAISAGARRLIVQSIAFAYAEGSLPHSEEDPLDPGQRGVISLEAQVMAAPLVGI